VAGKQGAEERTSREWITFKVILRSVRRRGFRDCRTASPQWRGVDPSVATPLPVRYRRSSERQPSQGYGSASKIDISGKRVGIILTGANVDLDALPWNL
jgi:hypothetical protein